MTLPPAYLVGLGGALGAVLRFGVGRVMDPVAFPGGTLTVNVLGSFGLGLLTFSGAGTDTIYLLGTGVCGAFTTFSTFSFETVRLVEDGRRRDGVLYAGGTLLSALSAIWLAWFLVAR